MIAPRKLGNSGLEITPLMLGGNVFGWTADEATSFRVLDEFVYAGGTMIDTADVYSSWVEGHRGGESEEIIGRWLRRNPGKRTRVQIATKIGFYDGVGRAAVPKACEACLTRLGIDEIDLLYQHRDHADVPLEESLGAFDKLVSEGKVRAIGLSQFTAERLDEAMTVAASEGFAPPCALQTWYNLLEREKLEGPLADIAMKHGLGIVPFYPLANGFLTGKYRSRKDLTKSVRGERVEGYLTGRGVRVLAAMDAIAAEARAPLAAIAIAWTLAQRGIAGALASATNVGQLRESLAGLHLELTPAQLDRLQAASA